MRVVLLLCWLSLLIGSGGCDGTGWGARGTARLEHEDTALKGTAEHTSRVLGGTHFEAIELAFPDGSALSILAPAFEERDYPIAHAEGEASFHASYAKGEGGAGIFTVTGGTLRIRRVGRSGIEGSFSFETANALARCADCPQGRGPRLQGRFNAAS